MNGKGASTVIERYLADLVAALESIDPSDIDRVIAALDHARNSGARIFVVGNGGSAATAAHLCTDMGVGLRRRGHPGFDVQCLSDNAAITTAVSNDLSYEDVFAAQIDGVIKPGDVLIAISASGNSPNILRAIEVAKRNRAQVVGVSGFDGGALRRAADISLHVDSAKGAYGLVEDVHLVFNHIITACCAAEAVQGATSSRQAEALERQPASGDGGRGWVRLGRKRRDEAGKKPARPFSWGGPRP